jgi:ankyrin repeat protein
MSSFFRVAAAAVLICCCCAAVAGPEADSQLATAIMSSDVEMARAALDAGADINGDLGEGRTPLITAVMTRKPAAVKLLLEKGADPNRSAGGAIGNAVTAAFFAMNGMALTGRTDEPNPAEQGEALNVLRLVAAQRPDCNVLVSRGPTRVTALMMAAEAGVPEAVKILLEAGASPNVANDGRYTALHYAVGRPPVWSQASSADRVQIVKLLLAAGAQRDRKAADGLDAIERAKRGGDRAVAETLATR